MGERWPDPDVLQRWVLAEGVPAGQVGALLGLSRAAGYRWLQRYAITNAAAPIGQEQLVALWRSGISADELAEKTGLPAEAVRDRLVAAAAMKPSRSYYVLGSNADPLPQDRLRGWYLHDRFSVTQIATLSGITPRQVRYRLARYRISAGRPGPKPRLSHRLDQPSLTKLYNDGLTCAQIGERYGAGAESVRALLAAYGIDRRAGGRRKRIDRGDLQQRTREAIATAHARVQEARRLTEEARLICYASRSS
jgi:transposase